jgi:hypothetical protein
LKPEVLTSASQHPDKVEFADCRLVDFGGIQNRVQASKTICDTGASHNYDNAVVVSEVHGTTVGTLKECGGLVGIVRLGEKTLGKA